jgi:hypothetical protein
LPAPRRHRALFFFVLLRNGPMKPIEATTVFSGQFMGE